MSSEQIPTTDGASASTPRMERWLAVMLSAFVPLIAAFLVSAEYRVPFFAVGGGLAGAGLLLLIVQERRR